MWCIIYLQGKSHKSQEERKEFKYQQFIWLRLVLCGLMISNKTCPKGFHIGVPVVLCSMLFVFALYIIEYRTPLLILSTPAPHSLHRRLTVTGPQR